ncbi:glycosyltransferase [Ignatzschineria cameli]|uniref:Glycosyltransferase 2-like domain-containing protein n=1 Tax=Ignatzschineria cameli TaxID=2182793 RepID=A0ABX5KZV3_9GAMM|nr:glycosyltransferase [Ignatzschineria cameli]PWD88521.1 hypothetical protein DC079_09320 [Ignatzschineria cameli]PWD89110.1 hypothetical protein DC081_09480 [Ignatzschineria cameli]PWD89958.1 hypothetical protein DC078_09255 [Ignatzschineria cameli]
MSFKKANELFRDGQYKLAEDIYRQLYESNPLGIYLSGLKLALKKQNKEFDSNCQNKEITLSSTKKILFVTSGLKGPTPGGGIATCFHSMIHTIGNLSNKEVDVLYLAHPYYSTYNYEYWKKHYQISCNANLKVLDINNKNYGSVEMKRSDAVLQYLIRYEADYDTVVFPDFSGLGYYSLLAQKNGLALLNLRIIISAHGNHKLSYYFGRKKVSQWTEKVILFMEKEVYRMATEITTPSYFYKKWIAENFNVDSSVITVIPNILLKESQATVKNVDLSYKDRSKKLLVFYGRFERLKGLDVFIDSLIELKNNHFNVLFAGNTTKIQGEDARDYIKKRLKDYPGEYYIRLNWKSEDLYDFVRNNNGLCVFPTLGETSSCVVVECIQEGIPFIASGIDPIKELINPAYHDSYLVTPGCSKSLCKVISNVEDNVPETSMLSFNMDENKNRWVKFLTSIRKTTYRPEAIDSYGPLVSVVIPTSDRPELLKESLNSIVKQTYKNIEIIIVDDASHEAYLNEKIAINYGAKYIFLEKKRYKGYACNVGVENAKGKYICFFDDDDIAYPEMIERYIKTFLLRPEVDILSGFANCFEHDDYIQKGKINPEYSSLALGGGLEVNLHINFFGKGTFIIKKEKFIKVGGYEVDFDSVPMVDYRFYIKAALKNLNIGNIPLNQYYYRKNSPRSLFYLNRGKVDMQFLAKTSMINILKDSLGEDIGGAFTSFIWDINLPKYE